MPSFVEHPDEKDAIISQLKKTRDLIQPFTNSEESGNSSDLYTTEHIRRHTQIFNELDRLIKANEAS